MCGDPLADIGRLLLELYSDWNLLQAFLEGYGLSLSEQQRRIIKFYAVNYELWFAQIPQPPYIDKNKELLMQLARS